MGLPELGERLGRRFINPQTKLGAALAVGIAGVLAVASGGDLEWGDQDPTPDQVVEACTHHPERNVYNPWRLRVIDTCVTETVTVVEARKERDGDYHVNVIPEHAGLINDLNRSRQHGYLLVEWVPRDPRPPTFRTGQRLRVTGTLVEDLQHGPAAPDCPRRLWGTGCKRGWREIHPVFAVEEVVDPGLAPAPDAPPIPGERDG